MTKSKKIVKPLRHDKEFIYSCVSVTVFGKNKSDISKYKVQLQQSGVSIKWRKS